MTAPVHPFTLIYGGPESWPYNGRLTLPIPDTDEGVEYTIAAMRACVDDAVEHSSALAGFTATIGGGQRPTPEQVYDALRRLVWFRHDPPGVEQVRIPDQLIDEIARRGYAYGDCDDRAVLGAAVMKRAGYKTALVVVSPTPDGRFRHVHFGYYDPVLIPMDPQEGPAFGKWHPNARRIKIFGV